MPFDGALLYKTAVELREAIDCHADKIYQPSRDELVFLLRKKGFTGRLLISAKPGSARVHFTDGKYENPEYPPMLCMLLRKHLSGARVTDIIQPATERMLIISFVTTNEMGDRVEPQLICELIGNQANIILADKNGKIFDCLRRSDPETSSRLLLPGAVYETPPSQGKHNPLDADTAELSDIILSTDEPSLSSAILKNTDGLSPLVCREIAFRVCGDDPPSSTVPRDSLNSALEYVIASIKSGGTPFLLSNADGSPRDFSFIPITQYGALCTGTAFNSYSELLDSFYARREQLARIAHAASDIIRLTQNNLSRAKKRMAARQNELKQCDDRERLRISGELLKANLYAITPGSSSVSVCNYYDEGLEQITIPLNPALSPAANAAKYFKDYKKSNTAKQTLELLTAEDLQEIAYLESVLDSISRCENLTTLGEIRDELSDGGYIKRQRAARKNTRINEFKEYTSAEGYKILVGKNNRQNDYITTVLASKSDMWFHVKNIPGSHVVVFCSGGEISNETVQMAATLAAENSKASGSSNVAVDYTPVKYVKKPGGAKPGMVIYTTNKTIYVTPGEEVK